MLGCASGCRPLRERFQTRGHRAGSLNGLLIEARLFPPGDKTL